MDLTADRTCYQNNTETTLLQENKGKLSMGAEEWTNRTYAQTDKQRNRDKDGQYFFL